MVPSQEASTERLTGTYATGVGKAHLNAATTVKRSEYTRLFGCPMIGTFNIKLASESKLRGKPFLKNGADSYWLVRLRKENQEVYAYAVRWEGSKMSQDRLELLSKRLIPEHFKTGRLDISIYEKWTPQQIEAWQFGLSNKTKWQGHKFWRPQRADSALVWRYLRENWDYRNTTVLDIGCNAGYFSFRAAQRGAMVTGMEKNKNILEVTRTIQHHIEMTDVNFRRGSYTDVLDCRHDFIFYLSVHHQIDVCYEHLSSTIEALRAWCNTLFFELINPPLHGGLIKEDVDRMIAKCGGKELVRYQHRVRQMRSLYVFEN